MDTIREDRDKYVGGSDIPAILNISPWKSRWDLLLEKADLKESDFEGNMYTEYGNVMEPKIREHINDIWKREYKPATKIAGDLRGNTDGYDGTTVIEIKTTSRDGKTPEDFKDYLVQLLFYMYLYKVNTGALAIYKRPEDFSEEFDEDALTTFIIKAEDYKEETARILAEIQIFRDDLDYLNDYPLSAEEDLPSRHALVPIINEIVTIEGRLMEFKELMDQYDKAKAELLSQMLEHNVKRWKTPSGILFTAVPAGDTKIVSVFDESGFQEDYPELYKEYQLTKMKKGKAAYVRITYPKG